MFGRLRLKWEISPFKGAVVHSFNRQDDTGALGVRVLISHFFNENFLLPYWLRHHRRLFDYGILIDYGSSDDSRDIIRDLAPDWEVVPARDPFFGALETDRHVMDIEAEVEKRFGTGTWKMALNATEFLVHPDLGGLLAEAGPAVKATGVAMVDHPAQRHDPLTTPDLFSQKWFGRIDPQHQRLLHRQTTGRYAPGRHTWHDEGLTPQVEDLLLLWFGWCPIDHVKERKLQIQHRIPPHDRSRGFGWHHHMDNGLLEKRYLEEEVPRCYWLHKASPDYSRAMADFHKRYGLTPQMPPVEAA
jgi:hypothetical protein